MSEPVTARWVIFDYGGVICQPQPEADLARLAGAAGCSRAEFEDAYWPHRLDYDRADLDGASYWQKVGAALGRTFTASQVAELTRLDTASWLHLHQGTVALIGEMAGAGHRLAMLSNAPLEVAEAVAALPVAALFGHLAFSCHLRATKPDPASYLAVLDRLGASPQEVVFLDDRPENVAGATGLGMRAVHFTSPADARAGLARCGITVAERRSG